ncbi:unnamed protein product [Calypogeia fissa]
MSSHLNLLLLVLAPLPQEEKEKQWTEQPADDETGLGDETAKPKEDVSDGEGDDADSGEDIKPTLRLRR